jgi:hypothetical protein
MPTRAPAPRPWRRPIAAALVALILAGCTAAQPGVVKRPPAPPPRRAEIAPVAPTTAHVWVPGQWAWHRDRYVWVPGHWEVPAVPGHVWVPGGWALRDGGYVWVEGHWRAR